MALALACSLLAVVPQGVPAHGPIGVLGDRNCSPMGGLGCTLRATEVIYWTVWGPAGSTGVYRERLSLIGVPTALDVDNRAGPDLTATVEVPTSGKIVFRISKLPGASASLPVTVAATQLDPNSNAPDNSRPFYNYGYDARRSSAPATFTETFSPRDDGIGINVSSSGAGSAALLGSRTQEVWPTGQVKSSTEARVDFTPMPTTIEADVSNTNVSGVETTNAELTVGQPSKVDVDFAQTTGSDHLDLRGSLDKLDRAVAPTRSAKVNLVQTPIANAEPADAERTDIDVKTTGTRVARGEVTLAEEKAGVLKSKTNAKFELLPHHSEITLAPQTATGPQQITIDPNGQAFDLVDVARANGEPKRLTEDQYAYVFDDGQLQSTGARIRGLKDATLEVASRPAARDRDLIHVKETSAGGPFKVLVDEPAKDRRVNAVIQNLPSTVDFTLRPNSTPTIEWRGSAGVAKTTVTIHDGTGIAKSEKEFLPGKSIVNVAKDLEIVADDLPTDLSVSLASGAKEISLKATDAKPGDTAPGKPADIGKLDVRLSTGPLAGDDKNFVDGLGATTDGAIVRDRLDRYVIFARITSLHGATLELEQKTKQDPLHVDLEHGPNYGTCKSSPCLVLPDGTPSLPARPFRAVVEDQEPVATPAPGGGFQAVPSTKLIEADVQDLPRAIDMKLRQEGTQTDPTIDYEGSGQIAKTTVKVHDDAGITKSSKTGLSAQDLLATLTKLPASVEATFLAAPGGKATVDVTAPGDPIGQVETQLWTRPGSSTSDQLPNAADRQFVTDLGVTMDGALVRDVADGPGGVDDRYVIFARLTSLKRAHLELDQQLVKLEPLTHGPQYATPAEPRRAFRALAEEPQKTTEALITSLPDIVHLRLREKGGPGTPNVDYKGSAIIGKVELKVHEDDADGVAKSERGTGQVAKDLKVDVDDLPTSVTANLDPSGKSIDLQASDEIGRTEVLLSTGGLTEQRDKDFVTALGTTKDGALVRDVSSRYVVFARLSKLRSAKLVLDKGAPDVRLVTGSRADTVVSVANEPIPECSDGRDNDGDNQADAVDSGCASASDDDETAAVASTGPDEEIDATVTNRPLCMRFALGKKRAQSAECSSGTLNLPEPAATDDSTTLIYEGGDATKAPQVTSGIEVKATGVKDLKGKSLVLTLGDIPARLEAVLIGREAVDMGTLGGSIGKVEVTLRQGQVDPGDVLPQNVDGVLARKRLSDTSGFPLQREVLFARMSRIRSLHLTLDPRRDPQEANEVVADLDVDSNPSPRPFSLDAEEDAVSTVFNLNTGQFESTRITNKTKASLEKLLPGMTVKVKVKDQAVPAKIHYDHTPASTAGQLTFKKQKVDPNQGGTLNEYIDLKADSVPNRIDFCYFGTAPACGLDQFKNNEVANHPGKMKDLDHGPSLLIDASDRLTVHYAQCFVPYQDGFCIKPSGADDPRSFLRIDKAKLTRFALELGAIEVRFFCHPVNRFDCRPVPPGDVPPSGWTEHKDPRTLVYVDTDNHALSMGPDPRDPAKGDGFFLKLTSPPSEFERLRGFIADDASLGVFRAQNRTVRIRKDLVPVIDASFQFSPAGNGTIECPKRKNILDPEAMNLFIDANFLGFVDADLAGPICDAPQSP